MTMSAALGIAATVFAASDAGARPQDAGAAGSPPSAAAAPSSTPANTPGASQAKPVKREPDPPQRSEETDNSLGLHLFKHLAEDQKAIWTSPARLRWDDADWLLPLGAVIGGSFATDTEVSKHLSNSPKRLHDSDQLSNYGVGALGVAGGGLFLLSEVTHDDHKRETGLLAAEAALNSYALAKAFDYGFGRERPLVDDYRGRFGQGGQSFPSTHAAVASAIAGVFVHEYPGPLTSLLAYGAAAAVGSARITGKQHFPTDVLIGEGLGYLASQQVYRKHHDPEIAGADWNTYAETREESSGGHRHFTGSPFVPVDSWIYPAILRLTSMGYVKGDFLDVRPWTRAECAQLVADAGDRLRGAEKDSPEAERIYDALAVEFERELHDAGPGADDAYRAKLESLYTRSMEITGRPVEDSYHFGETITNDYGRPYSQGYNNDTGYSGWVGEGRFVLYSRGEFEFAPGIPALSGAAEQAIATADQNPVQPAARVPAVDRFELLDTYVSAVADNWDFSFGKQSLWWGPGEGGAMMISNNALPIYMFRVSRVAPFRLPWILGWLGPMKIDAFFGKLSGNEFPPRPMLHAEKVSFKPTQNLELGWSRMAELGGVGRPLTIAALFNSYTGFQKSSVYYAANDNPGKRTSGFDFSYRLPFVRNWLTVYLDSIASDDPNPIDAPRRAALNPGLYLSHVPLIPKLEVRAEGVYTDTHTSRSNHGDFLYWDLFYHDLSTNERNLIGDWVGREGQGEQVWARYSFTTRTWLEAAGRHERIAKDFIPGGGSIQDLSLRGQYAFRQQWHFEAFVQRENWVFPILAATPQSNWTSSIAITFEPRFEK